MRIAALAAWATLAIPHVLPAQAHPLAGTWDLTYAAGMQVENGVTTPVEATATFTVTVEGDSLVAVLERPAMEGMPARPPARFTTPLSTTWPIVFRQISEAMLSMGGGTEKRTATSVWTLTVTGDTLEGTVERSIEGLQLPDAGPQPVRGVRKR